MANIEDMSFEDRMKIAERIAAEEEQWPRLKRFWKRVKGPLKTASICAFMMYAADEIVGDRVISGFCGELSEVVDSCWKEVKYSVKDFYTPSLNVQLNRVDSLEILPSQKYASFYSEKLPREKILLKGEYAETEKFLLSPDGQNVACPIRYCKVTNGDFLGSHSFIITKNTLNIFDIKTENLDQVFEFQFENGAHSYFFDFAWLNNNILIAGYQLPYESTFNESLLEICSLNLQGEKQVIAQFPGKSIYAIYASPCEQKFVLRHMVTGSSREVWTACDLSGSITQVEGGLFWDRFPFLTGTCFDSDGKGFYFTRGDVDYDREVFAPKQFDSDIQRPKHYAGFNLNNYRPMFQVQKNPVETYSLYYQGFGTFDCEVKITNLCMDDAWAACDGGVKVFREGKIYQVEFNPEKDY